MIECDAAGGNDADADYSCRLKRVRVSVEQFASLFRDTSATHPPTRYSVKDGVPHDAIFRRFYLDNERRLLVLVFEHASFPEVPEGNVIPEVRPMITAHPLINDATLFGRPIIPSEHCDAVATRHVLLRSDPEYGEPGGP